MLARTFEILFVALRLGLTSFGGPVAHLGYFRQEYVASRKWLDERTYADLVALCQFLPGPTSSQVGIAVGIYSRRAARRLCSMAGIHAAVGGHTHTVRLWRGRVWRLRGRRLVARAQDSRCCRGRFSGLGDGQDPGARPHGERPSLSQPPSRFSSGRTRPGTSFLSSRPDLPDGFCFDGRPTPKVQLLRRRRSAATWPLRACACFLSCSSVCR